MSFGQTFPYQNFARSPNTSQLLLPPGSKPPPSSTSADAIVTGNIQSPILTPEALRFLSTNPAAAAMAFPLLPPRFDPAAMPAMSNAATAEAFRNMAVAGGIPPLPLGLPSGLQGAPTMDFKPPDGFSALGSPHGLPGYYYDPALAAAYPYGADRFGNPLDLNGARRKNATRETTAALKAWLYEHRKNPYPTKGEKIMLAIITKMTLTQVSTWFANARRRLKKENKMTWSPRNRTGEDDDDDDVTDGNALGSDDEDLDDITADPPTNGQTTVLFEGTAINDDDDKSGTQNNNNKRRLENCQNSSSRPSSSGSTSPSLVDSVVPASSRGGVSTVADQSATTAATPAAKKPKIWSIAETLGTSSSPSGGDKSACVSSAAAASCVSGANSVTTSTMPPKLGVDQAATAALPFNFSFNPWAGHFNAFGALPGAGARPHPQLCVLPPGFPHPAAAVPPGFPQFLNPFQLSPPMAQNGLHHPGAIPPELFMPRAFFSAQQFLPCSLNSSFPMPAVVSVSTTPSISSPLSSVSSVASITTSANGPSTSITTTTVVTRENNGSPQKSTEDRLSTSTPPINEPENNAKSVSSRTSQDC